MQETINIALIIGSARSGTSVLGEMVAMHPDVTYLHEAHRIWRKAGLGENGSHRLKAVHAMPQMVRRIRKRFERELGAARLLVEKCPRSALRVPFIRSALPEAKLIHIVRDGRDVACSLLPRIVLPKHPMVFEFCRKIQNSTHDTYHAQRQVKWYRADHQVRVGRWRENLSDDEARAVQGILQPLLLRLGYLE